MASKVPATRLPCRLQTSANSFIYMAAVFSRSVTCLQPILESYSNTCLACYCYSFNLINEMYGKYCQVYPKFVVG